MPDHLHHAGLAAAGVLPADGETVRESAARHEQRLGQLGGARRRAAEAQAQLAALQAEEAAREEAALEEAALEWWRATCDALCRASCAVWYAVLCLLHAARALPSLSTTRPSLPIQPPRASRALRRSSVYR